MELAASGQVLGREEGLEAILGRLNRLGIGSVELWPVNIPVAGAPVKLQEFRYEGRSIEKAAELLKKYGVSVACVSVSGAFSAEMTEDIDLYCASLCHAIEVAGELGSSIVNHYCYHLALDADIDAALDRLRRAWDPAIEKAHDCGITLALENEAHDATRTPDGMLKILKAIGSEHFRTNYDACNYYHASQEGFPYAYDLLKEYVAYVHIKNGCIYNPGAGHGSDSRGGVFTGEHAPDHIYYPGISEGAVNIDGLLRRLESDGYDGYCTLEPHTIPANVERYWQADLAYLHSRGYFA